MSIRIKSVATDSLGEFLGLSPGDQILKINGTNVLDQLDYQFRIIDSNPILELEISGKRELIEVDKEEDTDLGVVVEDFKIREYLDRKLNQKVPYAAISSVEIERTREDVKLTIRTARPGVVIGANSAIGKNTVFCANSGVGADSDIGKNNFFTSVWPDNTVLGGINGAAPDPSSCP